MDMLCGLGDCLVPYRGWPVAPLALDGWWAWMVGLVP